MKPIMKYGFVVGMAAWVLWACSPAKDAAGTSAVLTPGSQDSTEYEIIITDMGFENWFLMNYSPAKDHSNEFYRSQNNVAVQLWNDYYRHGQHTRVVDDLISYRPDTDYGIEVNRKLFWYFRFVEEKYGIRLFL